MRLLSLAGFAVLAAIVLACSASDRSVFGSGSASGGANNTANTGTGAGDIISVGVGGLGGSAGLGCASDLSAVIDGNGNVIQMCWPDLGCSNGMCVPPCQAAAESKGNVGCTFTVATPHFYVGIRPPCFAVFVANNWPKDAEITVTRGGQSYSATQFGRIPDGTPTTSGWPAVPATGVPQDEVAVLFLSHDPLSNNAGSLACPVPPAVSASGGTAVWTQGGPNSNLGTAWEITTSIPVSAYDILPYGGASSYLPSAELILPTSAWGTNYVAVTPRPSSGPPWGQLVGSEDNTQVQILPSIALPAAGPAPFAQANVTTTFVLHKGQYVQWQLTTGQDMSGTVIQADKPVSFTGGDAYICYQSATSTGGGCDSAHQMIPPISAQSHEYVAMPYANRTAIAESIPYRIVGAVDGTTLTYDPPVAGAPTMINASQVANFETIGAFQINSQDDSHPFYVGQLMSGCLIMGGNNGLGDEEYVNILPPAQFLKKYVFFTDPTYPTTNLVVTRVNNGAGFQDVNIDCIGNVGGWQPVGTSGLYEVTNVDLIRLGVPNMGCQNGGHVADSQGQFGLMVWGLDTYSSYAYPAGGSVATINTVVVPPTPPN